jgi:nitrate/TMAO reductase-like tetraheme cytochrome c subunit
VKRRLPDLLYNPTSIAGGALAGVCLLTIVFLTLVDLFQNRPPAYIGIISYVILPIPMLLGLLLVSLGVVRERNRRRRGEPASRLVFIMDLNQPRQRAALTLFSTVGFVVLLLTAYGSYRVFEWTESVAFCGTTCHSVMEPEYTAYQVSPHARVKCVDCHVGSGAGWYVRSKLSGAYQVYAVLTNIYPRPIPSPIKNLRPAQETCEQCHWPSHFSGEKKVVNTYFKTDEQNTRWTIALLMKIGGGNESRGLASGIHWYMNIANEVQYVAADSARQDIPIVRIRSRSAGKTTEYVAESALAAADSLRRSSWLRMDCIDCHNRPSHIYWPPMRIVDRSMALGKISTALPNIREKGIEALTQPYASVGGAMDSIALLVRGYYAASVPQIASSQGGAIAAAVAELQTQYRGNFFPVMHARWSAYPNNIGHMTDRGCFRCHDGKHVSADGRRITKECNSCHTILYQGTDPAPQTISLAGLPFQHPEDIGDTWKDVNCAECHSGQ